MSVPYSVDLPTEEELTVEEVNLSGSVLKAAASHLGKQCLFENNEYMLCKTENTDPRACLKEGKDVTSCALNFFRQVKKSCADEFMQYANCIDKSSTYASFEPCRKTQAVFDTCMVDNLGIERPPFGEFCRVQVHKANRPRMPEEPKLEYPDPTPYLPDDVEKPTAKYGSRFIYMW